MYTAANYDSEIYPGLYHSLGRIDEQLENSNIKISSARHIRAHLTESGDIYILRIYTGNLEKENLFIYTTSSDLLIYGRKKNHKLSGCEFDKNIIKLPSDADTNFVTSEFQNGLLTLYLSKKDKHMMNFPGMLIVY